MSVFFFRIPSATDDSSVSLRHRWKGAIETRKGQRSLDQIQDPRVCSKHFISGSHKLHYGNKFIMLVMG